MSTIKAHNPAQVSPGLGWAVQSVAASVLSSSCGIPWEAQFQVKSPASVQHTGIPVPASSPVLGELKSIWALALWSNILNKEPCKAIPCVWLSLKLFVTRTTGKTPASQRTYSHMLGGFQHCLEGLGENYLKGWGRKREAHRSMIVPSHLRQMSTWVRYLYRDSYISEK